MAGAEDAPRIIPDLEHGELGELHRLLGEPEEVGAVVRVTDQGASEPVVLLRGG
jgi:hypothetical protein